MTATRKRSRKCVWEPASWFSWRSLIDHLDEHLPIGTVTVERVRLVKCFGTVHRCRRKFVIRVSNRLPWESAVFTLCEEWAHAMTWPVTDHTDQWGINYAKAIREAEAWEKSDDD